MPKDVRVVSGKAEIIRSLETGDYREAPRLGHALGRRFETQRRVTTYRDEI